MSAAKRSGHNRRKPKAYTPDVYYRGFMPKPTGEAIATESINDLSPDLFFAKYVSKRRPVVIDGFPLDQEWQAHRWTDLDYLAERAGQVPVKVEPVHPELGHFGTAAKRHQTTFGEYLHLLRDDKSRGKWYLTTQYEDSDEEDGGRPRASSSKPPTPNGKRKREMSDSKSQESESDSESLADSDASTSSSSSTLALRDLPIAPDYLELDKERFKPLPLDPLLPSPTDALADDFPLQPKLMGNLVLQQANLWLGNCTEAKSSGLHHDFHDNLYALISGVKRFLLFSPPCFQFLDPRGTIEVLHHNGLPVYTPRGEYHINHPFRSRDCIRADGLSAGEAARWQLQSRHRSLRRAYDSAPRRSSDGHLPLHMRKGKGRMTAEQAEALASYECGAHLVKHHVILEMGEEIEQEEVDIANGANGESSDLVSELEDDDDDDDDDLNRYYSSGEEFDSSWEHLDEEASSDPADIDDPRALTVQAMAEVLQRQLAHASPDVAASIQRYLTTSQENLRLQNARRETLAEASSRESSPADDDDDDDDDIDDLCVDGAREEFSSQLSASDSEDNGSVLKIPVRPGQNLPGGLRRDDREADVYEEMLLADEEGLAFAAAGDDEDSDLDDDDYAALMSEHVGRLRDGRAIRSGDLVVEVATPSGESEGTEEQEEEEGDSDKRSAFRQRDGQKTSDEEEDSDDERQAMLLARVMAHPEGRVAMLQLQQDLKRAIEQDEENEGSEDGHWAEALEGRGTAEDEGEDEEVGEDTDDDDDDDESGDVFPDGDETEGSEFFGDVADGEAALEALAAQDISGSRQAPGKGSPQASEDQEPLSFSRIDPHALHTYYGLSPAAAPSSKSKRSPRPRNGCPLPYEVVLQPGQMLYLPVGWWHEVTSQADRGGKDKVHCALNWWFHPPDQLDMRLDRHHTHMPTAGSAQGTAGSPAPPTPFDQPYQDVEAWDAIRRKVHKELTRASKAAAKSHAQAASGPTDVDAKSVSRLAGHDAKGKTPSLPLSGRDDSSSEDGREDDEAADATAQRQKKKLRS